jgi:hypothetical protein
MAAVTIEILIGTKLKFKIYPLTYIHANFDGFVPKYTILYLSRCTNSSLSNFERVIDWKGNITKVIFISLVIDLKGKISYLEFRNSGKGECYMPTPLKVGGHK